MAYDDTASRRSYGSRSSRYDNRGTAAEYYEPERTSGGGGGRRARASYYEPEAPLADNSQLARRSQLPAAYYQDADRSVRSGRSGRSGRESGRGYSQSRSRSRSITPPKRTSTRRGDLISAAAGAIALTAADKFLIEPRMKHGRRSKSQHETLRRVADVGVGGAAGTAIYRAVSRSRARKKGALADSRPGSPDSRRGGRSKSRGRGRSESRDGSGSRERSKSQLPWKSLLGTAGGALAGLAAEHFKNRSDQSADRGGGRSKSRRRDDSDDESDYSSRKPRRHRSADDYDDRRSKGGRDRGYSDEDDSEDDHRHRSSRRSKSHRKRDGGGGGETPHQGRDLVQEAIGLLGVAQGLRGGNRKQAAVETAIGAAGLAQNYYERQKMNKQAAGR